MTTLAPEVGTDGTLEGESDGNAGFLRAARDGNLNEVLEYLKGSTDINTSNPNGLNALHLASKEGHVNIVTELLRRGANVEAATKKGNTALHIASLAGHEDIIKILTENGARVNVQAQAGFTPLYMAAQEGHSEVLKFLLANGANQSLATEDGFTPLAVALQQGHDRVVSVLLEHDSKGKVKLPALHIAAKKDDVKSAALLLQNEQNNVNTETKSGFTPLHIASHYGNTNVANLLIQRGADVNFKAKNFITPLHVAARWGKANMVTLLLDNGANIDERTRDGLTPLHCAARSGHEGVVDLLLERGAPNSAKTKNGLTPLHMAAQGDHVDCARLLLYHKAQLDEITVDYLTPLHVAAHCGNVKTAKLLLDRKCEPNARALNGFTPLHIACKKNRIKVVELLLKYGASIEATTESGLTPLHVASFMGHMNIVIYLIQHNANPDTPTVRGETSLHLAARANQTDIIRILLRNGATVDATAREKQTPLHIAARLGNVDNVVLLLQHGASPDATTKDLYTPLHIAAKEGHEEVAQVLLDNGASHSMTTKKGFTPLHIAAKYGNIKVARLLLQKEANPDVQGKNGLTPLHVATHYNHVNVAQLLLEHKANPHSAAKNGYTPLHIAAKKNQMDIATTLLEYGAKPNAESKNGFTPLHLAAQEGHTDIVSLLLEHQANVNAKAHNGLTPMHLAAQEDKTPVAEILVKYNSEVDPPTKAGYTPLHTASHFGQQNMVRFLLDQKASVNATTKMGYTPLHQAAQQGHVQVCNILLKQNASPNAVTNNGQTPLAIAQKLGYISVVDTLKGVTEVQTIPATEDKYKVVSPETMQETLISDSEDEGGDDFLPQSPLFGKPLSEQHVYLPYYEGQKMQNREDSLSLERGGSISPLDQSFEKDYMEAQITSSAYAPAYASRPDNRYQTGTAPQGEAARYSSYSGSSFSTSFDPDNVPVDRAPVYSGFLISFMVDARGGAMRGCRHSGVRIIIPPRKASMPTRVTCRLLKKEKLMHPPSLNEGEGLAARILEMGPVATKFLGPIIIEVPHFASLRGKEREVVIMRSDNGKNWYEHPMVATEEAVNDALGGSLEGAEGVTPTQSQSGSVSSLWKLDQEEELTAKRITRILTTDFPQYFALVTKVRQENKQIGEEGGVISSTVVPQVQAVFPEGALTKTIRVGLQAQPIAPELVAKQLGNRVAVSPIVTVEPRRRKFHKPITLTIPVPKASQKGMINQYGGDRPTLRLLYSISGNNSHNSRGEKEPAVWEDITDAKPMSLVNDCVSFTTTVSARFWLIDCQNIQEATQMATALYKESIIVPYMAKFVIFAKRDSQEEGKLRMFCMTDDKVDKTLEKQEKFSEVARSRDIEVLEGRPQFVEMAGNLIPVTKSGDQLHVNFKSFRENRLPCTVKIRDLDQEPSARVAFMKEPKVARGEAPQSPICNLNITLPDMSKSESSLEDSESLEIRKRHSLLREHGIVVQDTVSRGQMKLTDIADTLQGDWVILAQQLDITMSEINRIKTDYNTVNDQALAMLNLWVQKKKEKATGNALESALRKINREDVAQKCMYDIETVEDEMEAAAARVAMDQSGFDTFKEEVGITKDSMKRGMSLDVQYDEQDLIKESESAAEESSPSSDRGSFVDRTAPKVEAEVTEERHSVSEDTIVKVAKGSKEEPMQQVQQAQAHAPCVDMEPERSPSESSMVYKGDQDQGYAEDEETVKTPPPSPSEKQPSPEERITPYSNVEQAAARLAAEAEGADQSESEQAEWLKQKEAEEQLRRQQQEEEAELHRKQAEQYRKEAEERAQQQKADDERRRQEAEAERQRLNDEHLRQQENEAERLRQAELDADRLKQEAASLEQRGADRDTELEEERQRKLEKERAADLVEVDRLRRQREDEDEIERQELDEQERQRSEVDDDQYRPQMDRGDDGVRVPDSETSVEAVHSDRVASLPPGGPMSLEPEPYPETAEQIISPTSDGSYHDGPSSVPEPQMPAGFVAEDRVTDKESPMYDYDPRFDEFVDRREEYIVKETTTEKKATSPTYSIPYSITGQPDVTGQEPGITATGQPEVITSEQQPGVFATSPQSEVITSEQQPGVFATSPQSEVITTEQQPGVLATSPQSEVITTEQQPRVFAAGQQPGVFATSPLSEVITTEQQPGIFATEQQPGVFATEQQPGVFATSPQSEVITTEQLRPFSTGEPDVTVEGQEPKVIVTTKQPEASFAGIQPVFPATVEHGTEFKDQAPEVAVAGTQPEQLSRKPDVLTGMTGVQLITTTQQYYDEEPSEESAQVFDQVFDPSLSTHETMYEEVLPDGTKVKHRKIQHEGKSVGARVMELVESEGPAHDREEVQEFEEVLPDGTVHHTHMVRRQSLKHIKRTLSTDQEEKSLYDREEVIPGTKRENLLETFVAPPKCVTEEEEVEHVLPDGKTVKRHVILNRMVHHIKTHQDSFDEDTGTVEQEDYEIEEVIPGTVSAFVAGQDSETDSEDELSGQIFADMEEYQEVLDDGTVVTKKFLISEEKRTVRSRSGSIDESEEARRVEEVAVTPGSFVQGESGPYDSTGHVPVQTRERVAHFEEVRHGGIVEDTLLLREDTERKGILQQRTVLDDTPDSFGTAGDDSIGSMNSSLTTSVDGAESTKLMLKKEIHMKTTLGPDGREQTMVKEDIQVRQENDPPEELRDSMQEIINQFMVSEMPQQRQALEDDV